MDGFSTVLQLLAVVVLVLLNGFFVATEFSLVSVRRTRIDQLVTEGSASAVVVQRALTHLDSFIAATQLGITMASLGLGWLGEPALAHLIEPLLMFLPQAIAETTAHTLAVSVSFVIITILHIVFGELAPKTIALQRPESTALIVTWPTEIFMKVLWPFIAVMNGAGNLVVRLVGLKPVSGHGAVHSAEELRLLVEESGDAGILDASEEAMLINVFAFADRPTPHAMRPRTEVIMVSHDATYTDVMELLAETGYTRYPVVERGDVDNIVGICSVKDLVIAHSTEPLAQDAPISPFIRPAFFTPESKRIGSLLHIMRKERVRMAIVIDEHGGMAGIVTLEDLLEEIVGDLFDDQEEERQDIQSIDELTSVVDGHMRVEEANAALGLQIPEGDYASLGGFVMVRLGRVPEVGAQVTIEGVQLTVREMHGPRIKRIEIHKE